VEPFRSFGMYLVICGGVSIVDLRLPRHVLRLWDAGRAPRAANGCGKSDVPYSHYEPEKRCAKAAANNEMSADSGSP